MNDIKITKYSYKQRCDIRGCTNLAEVTVGAERYPEGQKLNVCRECLQAIVKASGIQIEPIKPIEDKASVQEVHTPVETVQKVELIDRVFLTLKELKLIAKERGLTGYSNMDKESVIKLLIGGK